MPRRRRGGLLGSQFFTTHLAGSPWPAAHLVANVNFDGGNIWGRARDITQLGCGKSSLAAIVDGAFAVQCRLVKPDQFPDRGSFYRSDQFSFAKVGIPARYRKTGTDFEGRPRLGHRADPGVRGEALPPTELRARPHWSFEGLVDDTRLALAAVREIADSDQAPTWVPGDEFDAARRRDRP